MKVPRFPAVFRCALLALVAATLTAPPGRAAEVCTFGFHFTPTGNFTATKKAAFGQVSDAASGPTWKFSKSASFGFLSAQASADTSVYYNSGTANQHSSKAYWFDQIMITAPGIPEGTFGEALVTFYFDGALATTRSAFGQSQGVDPSAGIGYRFYGTSEYATGQANPDTGQFENLRSTPVDGPNLIGSDFRNLPRQLTFIFIFGRPTDLMLQVTAGARVTNGYDVNTNSARAEIRCNGYNGLDKVYIRDGSASPLTNYTVTSLTGGFNFAVPTTNTYSNWATTYNLTGPSAAATADPNANGLLNTLEYALGLNPTATGGFLGTAQGTVQVDGKLYQTFSHTRPARGARVGDFTYAVERATSLQTGDWTASAQEVAPVSVVLGTGNLETVTVRTTHPIAETAKEFVRLKVTPTAP